MKLLRIPTTEYLLDSGINALHSQSNDWIYDLAFWTDEAAFLNSLLSKKDVKSSNNGAAFAFENLEKELFQLTNRELPKLTEEVKSHENFLSRQLDSVYSDVALYREKHKLLSEKFSAFEKKFHQSKKNIFNWYKLSHL